MSEYYSFSFIIDIIKYKIKVSKLFYNYSFKLYIKLF